jgi:hypothetical protein
VKNPALGRVIFVVKKQLFQGILTLTSSLGRDSATKSLRKPSGDLQDDVVASQLKMMVTSLAVE